MKTIRYLTYYYPFSFDEAGKICTEVRIYVNDALVETWESNNIVDGDELEEVKKQKAKEYGISELSERNN